MRKQHGLTITGLLIVSAVLVFVAIIGFKLAPSYIEYFTIKRVVNDIAMENRGGSVKEVISAFNRRAQIDDIRSLRGNDLEVSKTGEGFQIRAEYSVLVPLFYNVSAHIDFVAENAN